MLTAELSDVSCGTIPVVWLLRLTALLSVAGNGCTLAEVGLSGGRGGPEVANFEGRESTAALASLLTALTTTIT